MNNNIKISRKELYDKVWATPVTQLAKEFNLSDNGLRKICIKYVIPLPPVGYWQKLQYGKKVVKPDLPEVEEENEINIHVDSLKENIYSENSIRRIVSAEIRSNSALVLKVNDRLSNSDDIVIKTKSNLEKKKLSESYERVKGTIGTDRGLPSIIVSPKNVSRSLRILNNLINNFKLLGYKIILNDEGLNVVAYDDDKMLIYIREKSKVLLTPNRWGGNDRDLIANGKLAVKVGRFGTFEFVDTDKNIIEDQIEKILIKVETEFREMDERRKLWKTEQERKEKSRKIEEAKQELKDNELKKFIGFFNDAHRWKKFTVLKEYFEHVKNINPDDLEWIQWAEKKLDWYNPAKNEFDDLLNHVDKDTLEDTSKKKWKW